jgi:hypothetical protein
MGRYVQSDVGGALLARYCCDGCDAEESPSGAEGPRGWIAGWTRALLARAATAMLRRVDLCGLCASRTPLPKWDGRALCPLSPVRARLEDIARAL